MTYATLSSYLPYGPYQSISLGNGLSTTVTYDNRYQFDGQTVGGNPQLLNHDYTHDANGNVTASEDLINSAKNKTYGYDAMYRLSSATGPWPSSGSLSYTYDPVGNRLTEGGSLGSSTYNYTDNLLTDITGTKNKTFSYDANGNTVTENNRAYIYNQDNRLIQVTENSVTVGTYIYDGQGRRVKKVANGQTTYFLYDQQSRVIAEADGSGDVVTEYLYLPDRPLVKIDIDGSTEGVYYYHTDHLGTPIFLTNSTGQKVWSAELLPFGEGWEINEDVDGDQVNVVNNLRFPGQYYDAETGLHYNVMRDYNPLTGRYIESDPIGLMGGINTFAYVEDSPLNWIDPWGLARGEILYFSRKPGSDFPYHVGFDQGNNQILMLNGGYIRSRGLDQYLTETGYGILGYADISDYIRADQFEENIIGAKEFLEGNFRDWNPEGTMCIDVMNVGFGDAYNKLKNDIKKKIGDSSDSYYWRRNSTYLKFFKSTGRFRQ